jgi:hypothetical protein
MAVPGNFGPRPFEVPLRSTRPHVASQPGFQPEPGFPPPPSGIDDLPTNIPDRVFSPPIPDMQSPPPPPPPSQWTPPVHSVPPGFPHVWSTAGTVRGGPPGYDPTLPPTYTSGAPGEVDASPMGPPLSPRVRFADDAASVSSLGTEVEGDDAGAGAARRNF